MLMVVAGHDAHGRTFVGVWQVWPEYYRICMHTSGKHLCSFSLFSLPLFLLFTYVHCLDIHITRLRVYSSGGVPVDATHPVDCVRMVSCGRGNVRAWRLKEKAKVDAADADAANADPSQRQKR